MNIKNISAFILLSCNVNATIWDWFVTKEATEEKAEDSIIVTQVEKSVQVDEKDLPRFRDVAFKVLKDMKRREAVTYSDAKQTFELQDSLDRAVGDIEAPPSPTGSDLSDSSRYVKDKIVIEFFRDKSTSLEHKIKVGTRIFSAITTSISGLVIYLVSKGC